MAHLLPSYFFQCFLVSTICETMNLPRKREHCTLTQELHVLQWVVCRERLSSGFDTNLTCFYNPNSTSNWFEVLPDGSESHLIPRIFFFLPSQNRSSISHSVGMHERYMRKNGKCSMQSLLHENPQRWAPPL